jgi:hypothetical protein
VHRQDLGVREPRGNADLSKESLGLVRLGAAGKQHFHGDLAAVLEILRQIDRGHPAATDLFLDAVSFRHGGTQAVRNLGHISPLPSSKIATPQ